MRRRFYRQFLPRHALCFDVGANVGNRTEVFLDLGARVVAVEPVAEVAAALRKRLTSARLTVLESALGDCEQQAVLYVCVPAKLSSLSQDWLDVTDRSGRFPRRSMVEQRWVPITTLDQLIRKFGVPDFVKIDVEGYELEVLGGLSQPVPALSFEYHRETLTSAVACLEHLSTLGELHSNYSRGESMRLQLKDWVAPVVLRAHLETDAAADARQWGDIYVRFSRKTREGVIRNVA